MYTVYILQSKKTGGYYTGSTQDLDNRLAVHNSGETKSTRSGIPWQLVHFEEFPTHADAIRKEGKIKARGAERYLKGLDRNHHG